MIHNLIARVSGKVRGKKRGGQRKTPKKKGGKASSKKKRVPPVDLQMRRLQKELAEFAKAADAYLEGVIQYAAVHPDGIDKVERHVLKASSTIQKLKESLP